MKNPVFTAISSLGTSAIKTLIGFLLFTSLAMLAIAVFSDNPQRGLVPLAFVAVAMLTAWLCGAMAAVAGLIATAVLFAAFLLNPIAGMGASTALARRNLAWMVLVGLPLSLVFARPPVRKH